VIINSLFPDPVLPAINPCGPCAFSWISNTIGIPLVSIPIGACKDFVESFVIHLCNIFNCSILPASYISKKVYTSGNANFDVALSLMGILDNLCPIFSKKNVKDGSK